MKKLLSIIAALLITVGTYAQYFKGTFIKDAAFATNNKIIFRINPTANITTSIAYMEFAFRYPTASAPTFSNTAPVLNLVNFPGLVLQNRGNIVIGAYTYVRYVHNTATIASKTYMPDPNGYEVFSITVSGAPSPVSLIEMASDVNGLVGDFLFGIVDGAANFFDPLGGDELYGTGYNYTGNIHLVPLVSIVLPVQFSYFDVTKKDDNANLAWTVASENSQNATYEVERSLDGFNFDRIQSIAANNNGNYNYSTIDANLSKIPNAVSVGIVYYRIKQIDVNGKFVYTDVKTVRLIDKGTLITLFPNPVNDYTTVRVDATKAESATMTLLNVDGKQLQTISVKLNKGINDTKVVMNTLPAGNYMLKVTTGTEVKTIKLIKL
jgi:hypothetical protein